ncbi:putative transcription factor-like [Capsicum annuum]|nr:putative transcription factor-like [Capsicum annuum]
MSLKVSACQKLEEKNVRGSSTEWGKVSAVLFDMDGVLCNSEEPSRKAAVDVFAEMGVHATVDDFVPFMGMGEANFLGGVASAKGIEGFDTEAAKKRFFEIYLFKYAKPNSGIGFPGAFELVSQCKSNGLKVAVASSADRIKVDANLAAAGLPITIDLISTPEALGFLSITSAEGIAGHKHFVDIMNLLVMESGAQTPNVVVFLYGLGQSFPYKLTFGVKLCPRFDAIVSADAFKNLKPAPDIFLAASRILDVPISECIVIEDALAGVQAAKAAKMRCIAVTTTLAEDILKAGEPSLIRKEISDISLEDILNGGSGSHNVMVQESQPINDLAPASPEFNMTGSITELSNYPTSGAVSSIGGVQVTRRNVVRYGSLGIAASCLLFTITNWKAMQYASPKAIWNLLFGTGSPPFGQKEDASSTHRIQQFVDYISDVDARKSTTIVPEFPSKLDWLNSAPLQLGRDLKGKVVLLDFWTYCCINCMHVLPDLKFLEKKYKDMPFVVVGVHSAKFDNEKDLEAIRSAVLRYGITHPVVNDGEMNLWWELGVNSWPTFVLVGPNGKLLAQIAGEGHRKDLDYLVEAALLYYGKEKLLDSKPIPLRLEKDNDPRLLTSPLKFPGKLAVDVLNNRLFISDSNHNRIVGSSSLSSLYGYCLGLRNFECMNCSRLLASVALTDLEGNFLVQVGSTGAEGLRDGNFDDATFNRPQGLAYNAKKNLLYVADTENHALSDLDLAGEEYARNISGVGLCTRRRRGQGEGETGLLLNSPWDVCFEPENEIVYIAMAGQHQIWEHKTSDGVTRAFSGNGYERNLNGSSSTNTSFAQPSGISLSRDLKEAYIADSESSSIRAVDLRTGGSRSLAGGDPVFAENLFRFGDHDGIGSEVLLQHPLGVLYGKDGQIYIADSYNHKIKFYLLKLWCRMADKKQLPIKKLDPDSKRVTTLAGVGQAGFKDGAAVAAQFSEPSGVVEAENGRLYIADTNNSVIRYLDLNKSEAEVVTLELKGVQPPVRSKSLKRLRRRSGADTQTFVVNGGSSNEGTLNLRISVPEGYHFSKEAQSKFSIDVDPDNAAEVDPLEGNLSPEGSAVVHFRRTSASSSTGRVYCKVYYCKEDEVCLYQSLTFQVPFQEVNPDSAPAMITLPFDVKPKTSPASLQIPSRNGDVIELYLTHLVDVADVVPSIEYDFHEGGESCPDFDKELSEDLGDCYDLGFEEDFVEAAIPHEPTFTKHLSGCGTVDRGEDLGGGDDVSSIGKDLGGYCGGVFAISGGLGDGGIAARDENLGGGGGNFFANSGDFGDIGVSARGEDLGGGGVSTIGGDLNNGGAAARAQYLADCGSGGGGSGRSDDLDSVNDVSATGENLGGVSAGINQNLGDTSFVTAADVPVIPSDWESKSDVSEKLDYCDFFDEGEDDEYGSDVHGEVKILREQKRAAKKKRSDETKKKKKQEPRARGVSLGKKRVDVRYYAILSKKKNSLEGKIAGDEPYIDSDDEVSFEIDSDQDIYGDAEQIMGDHVEEFKRIFDYRDELLKTNPSNTCIVRLSEETFEGGRKQFQSLYICFNALKRALKAGDLDSAISDLLPNAEQRMCAKHVLANWSKDWRVAAAAAATSREKESPAATAATMGVDRGKGTATCTVDRAIGRGRETDVAVVGGVGRVRGAGATVFCGAGRGRGASAAVVGGTGRGRGVGVAVVGGVSRGRGIGAAVVGGASRGRAAGIVVIGETGRGRGADAVDCTGTSRGDGVTGASKGRGITYKRPRMVGMRAFYTESGFKVLNPGIPMNSTIVTRNLGHHKPTSSVKWKGKKVVTQQGLEAIRAQKRMRTRSNVAELNNLSQTSSTTFQ